MEAVFKKGCLQVGPAIVAAPSPVEAGEGRSEDRQSRFEPAAQSAEWVPPDHRFRRVAIQKSDFLDAGNAYPAISSDNRDKAHQIVHTAGFIKSHHGVLDLPDLHG